MGEPAEQVIRHRRGTLRVRRPAPRVFCTVVDGHMDLELAQRIKVAGDEVLREDGRLLAFHDWERMETYDTEARRLLTSWGDDRRASIDGVHILFRSKLVAMGVSVAALVLGGMLRSHSSRQGFEAALREATPSAGAPVSRGAR